MSIKSFLNYISAILCGSFICLFFNMVNYPAELNPDISNYYNNFISKNWSYDIGYEFYQSLLRDLLGLNFQQFWLVTLFLICFFFFLISYKIEKLPFLVVNFIFLSEVFGT
ncbi:TPA: hypothetical protein ACPZZY_000815, partial [Enterobacter hormaechei subsp. xiangfangensis]